MRQVFIFIGFFICSSVLADHGGQGHSYNGRTFPCNSYEDSKRFAEKFGKGADYYNWALCQLHHGELDGITTLHKAADDMGDLHAAIVLAKYYISDRYNLPLRKMTRNEGNLQEAIDYRESALDIIRSLPNYPFDDPDSARIEKEDHVYLKTASNLTGNYMNLFGKRISKHIESTNTDIGNATLNSLKKAIKAADNCLKISPDTRLWPSHVYQNHLHMHLT